MKLLDEAIALRNRGVATIHGEFGRVFDAPSDSSPQKRNGRSLSLYPELLQGVNASCQGSPPRNSEEVVELFD